MSDSFDIDFKVLPPRLQMQLWVLALDANTSKVALAFRPGGFTTSLSYNYGGNVEASMSVRRVTATIGVQPTSGDVDLGLVYRGFRFGSSASVARRAASVELQYGTALLPFPSELATVFNAAGNGLPSLTKSIASAPDNPLAWYGLHSNDVKAITEAVSTGQAIAKQGEASENFGFGLRLRFDAATGLTIYGGFQMRF